MIAEKPVVDYSLYLVTGRELLPEGKVTLIFRPFQIVTLNVHRTIWNRLKK